MQVQLLQKESVMLFVIVSRVYVSSSCVYILSDDIIYTTDGDGHTFLHLATGTVSGEDMRKILCEIPLTVITRLLNTKNSRKRTPLCQAANWFTTNADVVIQMVGFVIEIFEEPGLLTFIIYLIF